MSAFGNSKIVDDGLVFMYDSRNKKSYRGEPTTLYGDPFPSGSSLPSGFHWSYEYDNQVVDAPIEGHFLSKEKWVKSTRDTTGSSRVLFINNSFVAGNTYTFSCYAYSTDTNLTSLAHVSHNSGYSVRTDYTEYATADLGKVKRIHGTWVQQVNASPIFGMQTNNAALGTTFYMTGFQVEEKSSATQLARITRGSRSVTQALKDRIGNSTIDLSNVSFDSNSQMTFDGTDDDIDVGTGTSTSYQRTIEMVFKTNSLASYTPLACYTRGGGQSVVGGKRMWLGFQSSKFQMHGWGTNDPASTTTIQTGKYYHAVYAYDQTTKKHYIWINGSLENNATNDQSGFTGWNSSGDHKWFVGGDPDHASWTASAGRSLNGEIPIFKVYDKILSNEEVLQNFNAIRSRFGI